MLSGSPSDPEDRPIGAVRASRSPAGCREVLSERKGLPFFATVVGVLLVLVAYLPSLRAPFYFDDVPNLVDPPVINSAEMSLESLKQIATSAPLPRRFIANLSFAVNHMLFGPEPRSFHIVNLGVHLAMGLAIAWIVCLYLGQHSSAKDARLVVYVAVFVSLIFLVHPLNVQAVTYVVQRMASMAGLFVVLAFACYLCGRRAGGKEKSLGWYGLATGFWVLGVFTKETAVALPLVLAAYEAAFYRHEWGGRLKRCWAVPSRRIMLVAGAVVGCFIAVVAVREYSGVRSLDFFEVMPGREFNGLQRVLTQSRIQLFYLSLLVWPSPGRLNLDHDFVLSRTLLDPPSTCPAVMLWVIAALGVVWLSRRNPAFGFPLAAYLLLHLMESGPLNLELVFEHRMYAPMAALALFLAVCLVEMGVNARRVTIAVLAAAGVAMAVATYQRNLVWAEPVAFFADAAAKSPINYRANFNFGTELAKLGRYQEARRVLEKAIAIDPNQSDVFNQLGNIGLLTGNLGSAARNYEAAIKRDPENVAALYNLGLVYERTGRARRALDAYRQFVDVASTMSHLGPKVVEVRGRIQRLSADIRTRGAAAAGTPSTVPEGVQ